GWSFHCGGGVRKVPPRCFIGPALHRLCVRGAGHGCGDQSRSAAFDGARRGETYLGSGRQIMKWLRRIYRGVSILSTAILLGVAAWIFWPTSQPTEQEMLRLVPTNAVAVFIQRDLAAHWPAFRASPFLKAWQNSPL